MFQGKIHNGFKIVFCYTLRLSPSCWVAQRCWTYTAMYLEEWTHAWLVYSVESVSSMWSILSTTFFVFFAVYGVLCGQQTHSNLGDRIDVFVTHLIIIIKSETSAFVIVIVSVDMCLGCLYYYNLTIASFRSWKVWDFVSGSILFIICANDWHHSLGPYQFVYISICT